MRNHIPAEIALQSAAVRNNPRLPAYYQLAFRSDREWIFRRWALSVFLEIVNLTYSQSVIGLTYPTEPNPLMARRQLEAGLRDQAGRAFHPQIVDALVASAASHGLKVILDCHRSRVPVLAIAGVTLAVLVLRTTQVWEATRV